MQIHSYGVERALLLTVITVGRVRTRITKPALARYLISYTEEGGLPLMKLTKSKVNESVIIQCYGNTERWNDGFALFLATKRRRSCTRFWAMMENWGTMWQIANFLPKCSWLTFGDIFSSQFQSSPLLRYQGVKEQTVSQILCWG